MQNLPLYYLYPSTLFVSKEPYEVTTILGSCVSVCMWDCKKRIGGINHYMLPLWGGNGLASPKYGDIAIEKLFGKMLSMGCLKGDLVIKVFGGAEVLENKTSYFAIPERNIEIAFLKLKELDLNISVHDTGGYNGRKIIFETHTGIVRSKIIPKQSNSSY